MGRLALILVSVQAVAGLTLPSPAQAPTNQSPAPARAPAQPASDTSLQVPVNASPVAPIDPAAAIFPKTATAGLLVVTVHADKVAAYEEVIRALQEGLSKSTDPRLQALGRGWRVFKSDTNPKANAIYVHLIDPVVPLTDYRPSLVLDEILAGASADMLVKYRDAIVGAPAMLGMNEFARMSMPPPATPTNSTPDAPVPPKKPGA